MVSSVVETDWAAVLRSLHLAADDHAVDDLIDAAADAVFEVGGTADAVPFLLEAIERAHSDLSIRSAALALALSAVPGSTEAVDLLVAVYQRVNGHPFLGPSLLDALGVLAVRDGLVWSQLVALLMRILPTNDAHLVARTATVIGRLDAVRLDVNLRAKLDELVATPDLVARAEVRYQIALSGLRDALLSDDLEKLHDRLVASTASFARAERSEEHRPDAAMFGLLLRMMLVFLQLSSDRQSAAARLERLASDLERRLNDLAAHDWHGYRSEDSTLLAVRIVRVADGLRRGAQAASEAEEWINFAAALEGLAQFHALIRCGASLAISDVRLSAALGRTSDTVFAAALGPLLARVVQLRRLSRIVSDYKLAHVDDDISIGLRALEQAAAAVAFAADSAIPEESVSAITRLAQRLHKPPETFISGLVSAVEEGWVDRWVQVVGLAADPLPIEQQDLYGGEPAVDEVVRPLLHHAAQLLGSYPVSKWARLVDVLVHLVRFTHLVRDLMPDYLRCTEDGGLGQQASELNLQEDLFKAFRLAFGSRAIYERTRTGGGRPDTGVAFPEAEFPVEVKHEFKSIEPGHVRENFVFQADTYAAAMDRVSFLMILDLRDVNAAGHKDRIALAKKSGDRPSAHGLYHLRDSFRAESLPTDPDIPNATTKMVVVGIVPGNRPLPSSMSNYSRRPSSIRRRKPEGSNV